MRVSAAALNHIDLWMRRGLPSMKIELPHVPGGDISGHVSALGAGVRCVELVEFWALLDRYHCSPGVE